MPFIEEMLMKDPPKFAFAIFETVNITVIITSNLDLGAGAG